MLYSIEEQARRGKLPSQLNMLEIASLWASNPHIEIERRNLVQTHLLTRMETAIVAGSLVADTDIFGTSPSAWRTNINADEILPAHFFTPKIERKDFAAWAASTDLWESVLESLLAGWVSGFEPESGLPRHKVEARDFAKAQWARDPDLTKVDVASKIKASITSCRPFTPKAIGEWIADLNPNKKPGRRRKKPPR